MLAGCSNLPRQRFSSTTSMQTCIKPLWLQTAAAYLVARGPGFCGYPLAGKGAGREGWVVEFTEIGCGRLQPISAGRSPAGGAGPGVWRIAKRSAGLRTALRSRLRRDSGQAAGPRFRTWV